MGHINIYHRFEIFYFCNEDHISHNFGSFFIIHLTPGKQQSRRFPPESIEQALSIRRARVSFCLAVIIETIQSRRAIGVMSFHAAFAFGLAARARRKSDGALGQKDSKSKRFGGFIYLL